MLGSESGSSDLSDASSLSSDNSSGSDADVRKEKKPQSAAGPQHPQIHAPSRPLHQHPSFNSTSSPSSSSSRPIVRPTARDTYASSSSTGSDNASDSGDSTDPNDDGNGGQGKRPPRHILTTNHHLSSPQSPRKQKKENSSKHTNAPISLSASQPVYSKEIMDGSVTVSPSNTKPNQHSSVSTPSRGRGRGRGRAPLAGHGSRKYDATGATGATVIDFEDFSAPLDEVAGAPARVSTTVDTSIAPTPHAPLIPNPVRKKKEKDLNAKVPKATSGATSKQKPGARKVGRPKTVSKDVYCVCRGPYDGVEFMIACDRCEEWFHGRCIGMKPQDAKKSSHYYCDTCQRIRRMFGVTDEPTKPEKTKVSSKKSEEKRVEKETPQIEMPGPREKLPLLKIKARVGSTATGPSGPTAVVNSTSQSMIQSTMDETSHLRVVPATDQIQESGPSLNLVDPAPSAKTPKRTLGVQHQKELNNSTRYNTPSMAPTPVQLPFNNSGNSFDRVSQDDDDEDVCPVCDNQCTCNTDDAAPIDSAPPPPPPVILAAVMEDAHTLTAIKVPFQPNIAPDLASAQQGSVSTEGKHHLSSFMDAEKRPVIMTKGSVTAQDETFHTSAKNPMSTPVSQRRLSIMRRGGKGVGKAPHLMQASKSRYVSQSRGKGLKGGKAAMHLYQQTRLSSGSEISDEFSDDGDVEDQGSEHGGYSHGSSSKGLAPSRQMYEDDSDAEGDLEDSLSLGSTSSLSDLEEDTAQFADELGAQTGRLSAGKEGPQSRSPISVTQATEKKNPRQTIENLVVVKKRGPGRPRKQKDPLIVSREDEMALYTPAVAARKLTTTVTLKGETCKPAHAIVKPKTRGELPIIAYDPEVAEDVMALNALDSDSQEEQYDIDTTIATPSMDEEPLAAYSAGDIFGDSDMSDELSGDLSDILSEDFDDFSDDGLDFSSSDEEDETSSSSSPREFHYSDMEEQDESLVDSDSSVNSMPTDSSDSSDSPTDSENETHLQEFSEEDEILVYEDEDSEESIDEEEVLRLEEQERLFLTKAHGLHDVFSEEDSDPDRNPFESSEDDEDQDERVFDGDDDDVYPEDYYEDDYYEDEYGDLDENEILERFRGVQSDMQALMMIPPEQQEQLLLLQHYEETHRLQQLQQQQAQDHGSDELGQDAQQNNHIAGLLAGSQLLPQFDVNVPDLDAVSEQLAASLASSIAESMAGSMAAKQALDGTLFQEAAANEGFATDTAATISTDNSVEAPISVSPRSASPPELLAATWATHMPSSPSSLNSNSGSIPTPANTPTPPGTVAGTSPSLPGTSYVNTSKLPADSDSGASQKIPAPQGNVQTLPNSPAYKPLTSIAAVPTIGGRPVQPILPKLVHGDSLSSLSPFAPEPQLVVLSHSRLQNGGPNSFKEAAQRALGGLGPKAPASSSGPGDPVTPKEELASGDTTDDASPDMHSTHLRKRQGDDAQEETVLAQGKRRRLSVVNVKAGSKAVAALSVPTPESEVSLPSSSLSSPPSSSVSMAVFDIANSSQSNSSSLGTTPTSELATYDFSKATMPFMDPTARILSPSIITQKHGWTSQPPAHARKHSLKGKELKQSDVMPMDDLLDTSALYGRSTSRSPSPDRSGGGEVEGDNEDSQAMLKDLNRWERVPIGTFRKSRRPSSPYVGLQGALKFGNVTMPTTLLADHQQHQQQLYQESHRLHKRAQGIRKHRSSSSTSDITRLVQEQGLLQGRPHPRPSRTHAASLMAQQTSSGSHTNMLVENGFESFLDHRQIAGVKGGPHHSQSSLGSLEGSLLSTLPIPGLSQLMARDPLRRRRRAGSSSASHGSRSGIRPGQFSNMGAPGSSMDQLHAGLGIGLENLRTSDASGSSLSQENGSSTNSASGVITDRATMEGLAQLRDLMTDSSQLPSSACPTPLHSPLFSATAATGRVHHQSSGEPVVVVGDSQSEKSTVDDLNNDMGPRGDEAIVSHLELDIGKEMDGFHERLMAQAKADSGSK